MREILFRAKRKSDGKWVEGYLVPILYDTRPTGYEIINKDGINYDELDYYQPNFVSEMVEPETISQYTGLCDKNGRKIWENDIVTKNNRFGKVVYGEKNCECCNGVYGWTFEHIGRYSTVVDIREQNTVEVVGNIFDNEEFLNISDEVE